MNLLMSGPAGGVTGALWVALQAGYPEPSDGGCGRNLDRRRADSERRAAPAARNHCRRRHGARIFSRYPHRGCRRRIDRACAGADQGIARRARKARARIPGPLPTAVAAPSRP